MAGMLGLALCACDEETSGGPADGGSPDAGLIISGLKVEAITANVLSVYVSWKTATPATSAVEVGQGGAYAHRFRDDKLVTDHKVLVIGLLPDTEHTLRAVSVDGKGVTGRSAPQTYKPTPLPAHIPYGRVTIHDRRRAHAGWTLMSVNAAKRTGLVISQDADFIPTAVMYDMEGRPRWYNAHTLGRIGDVRLVDNHVLAQSMADVAAGQPSALELDLAGKTVWTGPPQPIGSAHGHYHHQFEKLKSGRYLNLRSVMVGLVVGDKIQEIDKDHKVTWSWNTFDFLRPDTNHHADDHGVFSWTHINAVWPDEASGTMLVNARNLSTVYKVRMSDGEILWRFGSAGDFAPDPNVKYPWFEQPHGLELLPNGNLIMYDNGLLTRGFSRAVEYALDEQTRTSRIVWQYRGGPRGEGRWFVNYWGDADRLPNGNTLITAGTWKQGHNSRLVEVTQGGEVVWEMELPIRKKTGNSVGAFNSERIEPPLMERVGGE